MARGLTSSNLLGLGDLESYRNSLTGRCTVALLLKKSSDNFECKEGNISESNYLLTPLIMRIQNRATRHSLKNHYDLSRGATRMSLSPPEASSAMLPNVLDI